MTTDTDAVLDILIAACAGLTYADAGLSGTAPLVGYPFESTEQMAQMVTAALRARMTTPTPPGDWLGFIHDYVAWANKTFTSGTAQSAAIHLKREAVELADTLNPEEAADCFMLLLFIAHRLDIDLLAEAQRKFAINLTRQWGAPDAEGVAEHVRAPATPQPAAGEWAALRAALEAAQAAYDARGAEVVEWKRKFWITVKNNDDLRDALDDLARNGVFIASAKEEALTAALDAAVAENERLHGQRDMAEDSAKVSAWVAEQRETEVERLRKRTAWQVCATHGQINGDNAWGCPDCVSDLRREVSSLHERLQGIERVWRKQANDYLALESALATATAENGRLLEAYQVYQQAKANLQAKIDAATAEGRLVYYSDFAEQDVAIKARESFLQVAATFAAALAPRAVAGEGEQAMDDLTERRSKFVYDAARLAAVAAQAPIVPVPWDEREEPFKAQFRKVIERQCGEQRSRSPEELHGSWMQAYFVMGWVYGPVYSREDKIHPDLVPYADLGQLERDKDAVFVALCEIARQWVYDMPEPLFATAPAPPVAP